MEIKITCRGAESIPMDKLCHFQGDLKSLSSDNYKKFRKNLIDLGFSEPISVWIDGEGKYQILNGHQRLRTLKAMMGEGFTIGDIPINIVDAEDENEAKKKVLALTSAYGKMESQGLYKFLGETDIDPKEMDKVFEFSEINIDKFNKEYFPDGEITTEEEIDDKQEFIIVVTCADEESQSEVFENLQAQGLSCKIM